MVAPDEVQKFKPARLLPQCHMPQFHVDLNRHRHCCTAVGPPHPHRPVSARHPAPSQTIARPPWAPSTRLGASLSPRHPSSGRHRLSPHWPTSMRHRVTPPPTPSRPGPPLLVARPPPALPTPARCCIHRRPAAPGHLRPAPWPLPMIDGPGPPPPQRFFSILY
jgi:hypothetical protein